jgi:magnesium-protoporphyrin O-methyltransferase
MGDCCDEGCCPGYDEEFGAAAARGALDTLRRDGPRRDSADLIAALADGGVEGYTVLDIGAGVGAIHLALLEAGAATAVDVDASSAYVAAARQEAARRGLAERVTHHVGDFVAIAPTLPVADLVALDRVVCCYGDVDGLLSSAARLARRRLGLVYPVDRWWMRLAIRLENLWFSLRRRAFRSYVHAPAVVDRLVTEQGLQPVVRRGGLVWQLVVYERPT